jgi:tetratricopeptide (TPR) repeat protein
VQGARGCLLLVVGIALLYGAVLWHPFTNFDDDVYVFENSHVQQGLTWSTIKWAWTTDTEGNWHPLTWMSHELDWQIFGDNAGGHHLTSLTFHALNAAVLFLVLAALTGAPVRSWLVAALFAVHPFNVESVAWVAERKNVLSTLFFFLAIGAYGRYARQPGWKRYLSVAGLFALGLAAKPMVITLPFVLLLLDYWPLGRVEGWNRFSPVQDNPQFSWQKLIVEKLPLLALSAASAILTVHVQSTGGAVQSLEDFPFGVRADNAIVSYVAYLVKTFWPHNLAIYYPHPTQLLPLWQVTGASLLLVAITALSWRERNARPQIPVGWLWYLGTLVPVIGLVQVGGQAMADRYAYIPLVGIFVIVVWEAAELADRFALAPLWRMAAAAAVLVGVAVITVHQIGYWKSNMDLWMHAMDVSPSKSFYSIGEDKLGIALQEQGKDEEALTHFRRALELNQDDALANFDIGADMHNHGKIAEAVPYYQRTIANTADRVLRSQAYGNLGTAYGQLGKPDEARRAFLRGLEINPEAISLFAGLAELTGDHAFTQQAQALASHPTAAGFIELGREFRQAGRHDEARAAFQQASRLDPDLAEARQELKQEDRTY